MIKSEKLIFSIVFLLFTINGFAQVSQSTRMVTDKTLSVTGFEKDDRSFIEFFKKYPVWSQTSKHAQITIEFLGFEKESNSIKPFQFGKRPTQIANPIKGNVFIKSDGYNTVRMFFNNSGTVSWSVGKSNEEVTGTYNYNLDEGLVYVNMPKAKQEIFKIFKGSGKNLGITGEAVENIQLVNISTNEAFTKQSNSDPNDDGLYKPLPDLSWMFPENRFLIRYTLTHDRNMFENGNGRFITKKNQTEVKYAFIKQFTIVERLLPGGSGSDPYGVTLKDTTLPWKTVFMETVVAVGDNPYEKGMSINSLSGSPVGYVQLKLINWGQKRNEDAGFMNTGSNRLYINTAINRAGWDNKDGAVNTTSGETSTYNLPEVYYLCPTNNKPSSENLTFGVDIDANCFMSFKPVVNPQAGVKLSDVISTEIYKLESNSKLDYKNLKDKLYSFELISKKLFGKEKIRKGTWSINLNNQTVIFKFDDGENNEFLITKIRDGYFYQFKDKAGTMYEIAKVDPK